MNQTTCLGPFQVQNDKTNPESLQIIFLNWIFHPSLMQANEIQVRLAGHKVYSFLRVATRLLLTLDETFDVSSGPEVHP